MVPSLRSSGARDIGAKTSLKMDRRSGSLDRRRPAGAQ
jgi:hypothetical protein